MTLLMFAPLAGSSRPLNENRSCNQKKKKVQAAVVLLLDLVFAEELTEI